MDMDRDLQYRYGHAAWTRTRSMYINTQHGLEHAKCTCNMNMDMEKT